jgi:cytochrome P450
MPAPSVCIPEHDIWVTGRPARYGGRITTRAVEFDGVELPAGARLLLLWLAAGRDPAAHGHEHQPLRLRVAG